MEQLIAYLKKKGCNFDNAMNRFVNDQELYFSCLQSVVYDPAFELLEKALAEGNVENAFDQAHTLKGILANMELTPLYNHVVAILTPLRSGIIGDYTSEYNALCRERNDLRNHIDEVQTSPYKGN